MDFFCDLIISHSYNLVCDFDLPPFHVHLLVKRKSLSDFVSDKIFLSLLTKQCEKVTGHFTLSSPEADL